MATSATVTSIILTGPDDWNEWIEIIQTKAEAADIWPFIDPSIAESEELPTLERPKVPSLAEIIAERTRLTVISSASSASSSNDPNSQLATVPDTSPLTQREQEELKLRRHIYKQDSVTYERQKAAMRKPFILDTRNRLSNVLYMHPRMPYTLRNAGSSQEESGPDRPS